MKLNVSSKCQIGQLKAELRANELGYTVSRPTFDLRYDMILDDSKGNLYRTQVKYCNNEYINSDGKQRDDILRLELKGNEYSNDQIDLLLIFCPKIDKILAYGPKQFHNKKRIKIYLKNKNSKHFYEKYLW